MSPAPDGLNPHRGMTTPKRAGDESIHPESMKLSGEMLDACIARAYTQGREDQRIADGQQQAVALPEVFDNGWDAAVKHERERVQPIVQDLAQKLRALAGAVENSRMKQEYREAAQKIGQESADQLLRILGADPDELRAQQAQMREEGEARARMAQEVFDEGR